LRLLAGELADALLSGQKAVPAQLLRAGFVFRRPELGPALESIFKKSEKEAVA
jgi:NAD dependent epimerase/dehydratase family enzyme